MLEVQGLSVIFGHGAAAFRAVHDVSFQVARGESFGLVGESGSGKSTVLRAIAGLLPGISGTMSVAGQKLKPKRSTGFRRQVQMVFQDPYGSLHPRHTVDAILSEPLRIHRLDRVKERVLKVLAEVGLDASFRFRYPHQLSGGQRQRIAVARALVIEPQLVLLDEPTSALDVSVQAEVLNLLVRLRRDHGLTYVLVSHDLAVVGHMCERIAVMQFGEVVETMTLQQLRDNLPDHPYSRQLLRASAGYDRATADELDL